MPLLDPVSSQNTKLALYADGLSCSGEVQNHRIWWHKISKLDSKIDFFPKENRLWLVVKPEQYHAARDIFKETTLNKTKERQKHLGAVIGRIKYKKEYVISKINELVKELSLLSKSATFNPHAAYCTFTSGYRQKFRYIIQTIPDIKNFLQLVENIIQNWLIPSICECRTCSDDERQLLSISVKLGRIREINLTFISDIEYNSKKVSKSLYKTSSCKTTMKAIVLKIFNLLKKISTIIKQNFATTF